jgi:hypothetical protein
VLGLAATRLLAGKLLPGPICGLLVGVAGSRRRLVVGFLGLAFFGQYRRGHEERTRKTDEDDWSNPHLEVPLETSPNSGVDCGHFAPRSVPHWEGA